MFLCITVSKLNLRDARATCTWWTWLPITKVFHRHFENCQIHTVVTEKVGIQIQVFWFCDQCFFPSNCLLLSLYHGALFQESIWARSPGVSPPERLAQARTLRGTAPREQWGQRGTNAIFIQVLEKQKFPYIYIISVGSNFQPCIEHNTMKRWYSCFWQKRCIYGWGSEGTDCSLESTPSFVIWFSLLAGNMSTIMALVHLRRHARCRGLNVSDTVHTYKRFIL